MKSLHCEELLVQIYQNRAEMGRSAAGQAAEVLRSLLRQQESLRCVFAAAPSQNEFLEALVQQEGIAWQRVDAFHMDEYVGLPAGDPRTFSHFLRQAIFDRLPFRSVNLLDGTGDAAQECARYAALLQERPVDIVFMGIGENGHIAFNDPPVANFRDPAAVKVVELDRTCRMQQVHDACFSRLDDVPTHAITLTVPALVSARQIFCIVPGARKAAAVRQCLNGPVSERCPASILRHTPGAVLYLDEQSAALL